MSERKGLVLIYTGNGKGKTTAALGAGLRAVGHGYKVFMIQFMKGQGRTGELTSTKALPNFEMVQVGRPEFVNKDILDDNNFEAAEKGLELAKQAIKSGKYDLLILDEINVTVNYGLLLEEDVLDLLKQKPADMHIILTGRYASPALIEVADLVSEIQEIKHPYQKGIGAQVGIEY